MGRAATPSLMLNFVVQEFTSLTCVHHICASHLDIETPLPFPSPAPSLTVVLVPAVF